MIFDEMQCQNFDFASRREWVLPNGIGGFAMGTVSGVNTRRYHGLLIASLNPPTERTMLFPAIEAYAQVGQTKIPLCSNQYPGVIYPDGYQNCKKFELGDDFVRWHFQQGPVKFSRTVVVAKGKNEVTIWFENQGSKLAQLTVNPLVCFRDFHSNFYERESYPQSIEFDATETVIEEGGVKLVISHPGGSRAPVHGWYYRFEHLREVDRGLDPRDDLYCPCEIRYEIPPGGKIAIVASLSSFAAPREPQSVAKRTEKIGESLKSAVSRFVVETEQRSSIMAGFPWFSDWGRDTMISLPGVCLHTGRVELAREILRDYASQLSKGLIPNRFVEKGEKADYNTVDGTLWFGNAIYKTLEKEWDEKFAVEMLAVLDAIVSWHQKGTLYGIKVDPADGLLMQGEPGTQLTWMDAKIGDWVVTPRHGKPVEISALWINLLRVGEWIGNKLGKDISHFVSAAQLGEKNFDSKFWHSGRGHYLDTADPNDATLRPNQVLAMSLPFSPCAKENASRALAKVQAELLTPFGLRTLGPNEPGYRGRFKGGMPELDAAYHQGTVWPWLMGPYITAYIKNGGSRKEAKQQLSMIKEMLQDAGLGGISECYDGDEPHSPGGCPWQAWSAAELLRCWIEDLDGE
jgi:predicted glycogen debranching enzyme